MLDEVNKHFETDILVVGGGITGAGIFRDLALHQMDVTLIDGSDFSSKTSQSSTKMLHGGIRYLENLDLPLIFEALAEKNLWLKLAPHLTSERPFLLPIFNDSKRPLWQIAIGLFIYDLLSLFKNTPFKVLSKQETLLKTPGINNETLVGSGVYYDAVVDDSKLNLEVIFDALKCPKARAFNYHKLTQYHFDGEFHFSEVLDVINNIIYRIKSKHIVFALGPFTDELMIKLNVNQWGHKLSPSKGSHIWVSKKSIPIENPVVITTKDERVIFVIPHDDLILIGTTELKSQDLDPKISKDEVEYLLNNLNEYFPGYKINKDHILGHFSGIRPLVKEDGESLSKTSREHKMYMINKSAYVIAGGKYTTFRTMGREISENIVRTCKMAYDPSKTLNHLRVQSITPAFKKFQLDLVTLTNIIKNEHVKTFEDLIVRRLSCNSKLIFEIKTNLNFDQFFLENFDQIKHYLKISKEDIINFKSGKIDQTVI